MKRYPTAVLAILGCLSPSAIAQGTEAPLNARSTLVLVPAMVRNRNGDPVFSLTAKDFLLTDNGVAQTLHLEDDPGAQPLALVVDLEVGGAGTREFEKLGSLKTMLESVVGGVPHTIALVGFDSEPTVVQPFTPDALVISDAIAGLTPGCYRQHHQENCADPQSVHDASLGDNGAAILDSLALSVELLRRQPATYRRAILLVSETLDRGSKITLDEAVRAISDTNTTIYSVGFSTGKSEAAHYAHRQLPTGPATTAPVVQNSMPGSFTFFARENHIPNPQHGCMGKDPDPDPDKSQSRISQAYDCAGQLLPPLLFARMAGIVAVDGLRRNLPETVASLTGGEYFKLTDARSLERSLGSIANHLPNRYVLSFQPQAPSDGIHALHLQLRDRDSSLQVIARTTYWSSSPTENGQQKARP